jgi:chromosome partitioning protein
MRWRMRNTITFMNAKGGVGKSTLVLAIAETLATYHRKSVLVIDADAQASVSHLLAGQSQLEAALAEGRSVVDFLTSAVLKETPARWQDFVIADVSDVDDARSITLMPSETQLTLFEREVSKGDREAQLRRTIGAWLTEAGQLYDVVLIDSAPGLSVLTECFLREAQYYISPTKPDYVSTRGLKFLREFSKRDPQMGFADNLGVIVNMKDPHWAQDEQFEHWLRQDPENRCFEQPIPRASPLQATGLVSRHLRSYWAKYPGETGDNVRRLTVELLDRLTSAQHSALNDDTASHSETREYDPRRPEGDGKKKAIWSAWRGTAA